MNYEQTLDYINSVRLNQWKLGLSRTRELLHMLGDPQDSLKFVHIGGTNGKGSTSAMIESVLRKAGYRTGIFPSPFIEEFRERIRVSGGKISEDDLCRITERVKAAADRMEDEPSHFEIVTAIGMVYFNERNCDIVVLEVGLGGEFDATNIIRAPEAAVLTNIGLDHTDYLGTTLAEIARTKAGIIKSGSHVIVYPNLPEVMDVLREVCEDRGCEMSIADFGRMIQLDTDLSGQTLLWKGQDLIFKLPLIGDYQMRNATVALTAIEILQEKGWDISDMAIIEGMSEAEWQARFELLSDNPVFILDGGHNSQCAEAVAESLRKYLPNTKLTLVIGMLRDKDYSAVLDILLPFAEKCYCLTPESERALSADSLAELIREKGVSAESFETAEEILTKCFDEEAPGLAFGSLYMAGEIRKTHRRLSKKRIRDKAKSAREALSEEERDSFSKEICKKIAETEEYKKANIIFAYKYAGGEVRTDELEKAALAEGKLIAYPVCGAKSISNHLRADRENDYNLSTDGKDMVAVIPGEERDAWKESGCYGIREPALEKGKMIEPSEIDLIIAPCTSFDEELNRLGMGGGYYDGYLPKCENAKTFAVAFEVQKSDKIPTDEHDYAVNAVITEKTVYL